jgi:hypothetical protein
MLALYLEFGHGHFLPYSFQFTVATLTVSMSHRQYVTPSVCLTVSMSHCQYVTLSVCHTQALNDWMTLERESGGMWQEAVVA